MGSRLPGCQGEDDLEGVDYHREGHLRIEAAHNSRERTAKAGSPRHGSSPAKPATKRVS